MKPSALKLSQRLSLAFIAVICLTLLIAVLAMAQMARISDSTKEIATSWLPSVKLIGDIRASGNLLRRFEARHVMAFDEKAMDEMEAAIRDRKEQLNQKFSQYESLVSDPEDRRLWEGSKQLATTYYATQPKLFMLSRGGDKTFEEAKKYYLGESRSAFDALLAQIAKWVEHNDAGAAEAYAQAQAVYASARLWLIGLSLAALALAAVLASLVVRGVSRQLGGDPSDVAQVVAAMSEGDFSQRISVSQGDRASVIALMQGMQESLSQVVSQVRRGSEGVSNASAEIAQGNSNLSARTEQQASALQQTAASMEQLNATVKQNADSARQANQLAMSASTVAVKGGDVVSQVVETMKGINDASKRISDIIGVIDGIAFQTNILALNAAVEAARAGEQGRGFAVVASEVRSLAGRSAEAAKEIKSLIGASVERVQHGSTLVDQAGVTMTEVVNAIQRVTDLMGEISAASIEQSAGVSQVGEAVTQMDQTTQQNAALVEEMAAAATSLKNQAQDLVQTVSVFTLGDESRGRAHRPAPVLLN